MSTSRCGSGEIVGADRTERRRQELAARRAVRAAAAAGRSVEVAGRDVTSASFARRARDGLGRSFQHAELFPRHRRRDAGDRLRPLGRPRPASPTRCCARRRSDASEARRARPRRRAPRPVRSRRQRELRISELSTGQRRVVDLAALVANRPEVAPPRRTVERPRAGRGRGLGRPAPPHADRELDLTLIIVEHDIPLVSALADRLVALDQGRVIAGRPARRGPRRPARGLVVPRRRLGRAQRPGRRHRPRVIAGTPPVDPHQAEMFCGRPRIRHSSFATATRRGTTGAPGHGIGVP